MVPAGGNQAPNSRRAGDMPPIRKLRWAMPVGKMLVYEGLFYERPFYERLFYGRLGALVANCSSCGLPGRALWILA